MTDDISQTPADEGDDLSHSLSYADRSLIEAARLMALSPPIRITDGELFQNMPIVKKLIAEVEVIERLGSDISTKEASDSINSYGQNFGTYGQNFGTYGQNFGTYGQNFSNYGQNISEVEAAAVTVISDVNNKPRLPNGHFAPSNVDELMLLAASRLKSELKK